jgi:hypothetical protein
VGFFATTNEAPKGPGLLTFSRRPGRESEIPRLRFRGAEGTLGIPFGPLLFAGETEIAAEMAGSSQTVAGTGDKRETSGGRTLGTGR